MSPADADEPCFACYVDGAADPVGLRYPPEWKFDDNDDGVIVPPALHNDVLALIAKIARSTDDE